MLIKLKNIDINLRNMHICKYPNCNKTLYNYNQIKKHSKIHNNNFILKKLDIKKYIMKYDHDNELKYNEIQNLLINTNLNKLQLSPNSIIN